MANPPMIPSFTFVFTLVRALFNAEQCVNVSVELLFINPLKIVNPPLTLREIAVLATAEQF